ncbi:MAG: hypothetical protein ABI231_02565 [Candidatus Tumulicola sp.]
MVALRRVAPFVAGFAIAVAVAMSAAAAPKTESAAIADSGSTNTAGYKIDISSDGSALLTVQNRPNAAPIQPKKFAIAAAVTARFFADLKAVHGLKIAGSPCMKSASFGTSTHVSWNGWRSPDLDCPSPNEILDSLIRDVNAIRTASGVGALPGIHPGAGSGGPLRPEPSPS